MDLAVVLAALRLVALLRPGAEVRADEAHRRGVQLHPNRRAALVPQDGDAEVHARAHRRRAHVARVRRRIHRRPHRDVDADELLARQANVRRAVSPDRRVRVRVRARRGGSAAGVLERRPTGGGGGGVSGIVEGGPAGAGGRGGGGSGDVRGAHLAVQGALDDGLPLGRRGGVLLHEDFARGERDDLLEPDDDDVGAGGDVEPRRDVEARGRGLAVRVPRARPHAQVVRGGVAVDGLLQKRRADVAIPDALGPLFRQRVRLLRLEPGRRGAGRERGSVREGGEVLPSRGAGAGGGAGHLPAGGHLEEALQRALHPGPPVADPAATPTRRGSEGDTVIAHDSAHQASPEPRIRELAKLSRSSDGLRNRARGSAGFSPRGRHARLFEAEGKRTGRRAATVPVIRARAPRHRSDIPREAQRRRRP